MYVTCSFILMKIKSFSCETFCMNTRSEKEANSNSEVEIKSAVHGCVTPNIKFASTYLYTWVKRGSVRVKCHNTMYNVKCHNTMFSDRARIQTARNRKKYKNRITGCLHRLLSNFKINNWFLLELKHCYFIHLHTR